MNVRLICMDMDGTLFGEMGQVPEINKEALRACEKMGIKLALVSGRGYSFIRRKADEIGIHAAVASANGARIDDENGNTIFEGVFQKEKGEFIARLLLNENVNFEAYTKGRNYIARSELMPDAHKKSLHMYLKAGDVEAIYDDERIVTEAPANAYKFVVFSDKASEIDRIRTLLDSLGIKHCSSGSQNVEIMPEGADKGAALKRLCDYYHISPTDTMAFGDYTNDIDMLSASAHPVAMGNAVDSVKRIAEIVAPLNTEGGLGQVLFAHVIKEMKAQ
ncbi:MAG: HAD family phosphatase [Clostridia bacterium]|nr:HAD family phosphatase [Clostridia bacterium]